MKYRNFLEERGTGHMQMDRLTIRRMNLKEDTDDGFVEADRTSLFSMVWDLTLDVWSFAGEIHAEQRLQRDAGKLVKRTG